MSWGGKMARCVFMRSQPCVGWRTPLGEVGKIGYERTLLILLLSFKDESPKGLSLLSLHRELVGLTVDPVTERMCSSGWTSRRKAASSRVPS